MTINVTPIPRLTVLAAPAFVLGDSNVAGSALTAVASDSTLGLAATKAEMEAVSSAAKSATPARTQYHPGVAKGWGHIASDGALGSPSYGIGSVTYVSTGVRTIAWATNFSAATYSTVVGMEGNDTVSGDFSNFAVGSVTLTTYQDGAADDRAGSIAAFGAQ
jgi:hypothetical protein